MSNLYARNLQRLEKEIEDYQKLESEYRTRLMLTTDPIEKKKYSEQITAFKQMVDELTQEWEEVDQKLQDYRTRQQAQSLLSGPITEDPLLKSYSALAEAFKQGNLVLMLGPGINPTAMPSPTQLAKNLAASLSEKYPSYASENDGHSELVRISQHATVLENSDWLNQQLLTMLGQSFNPTPLHHFLASLPNLLRSKVKNPIYPIFITINYDSLLEEAFDQAREPYDLLCYSDEDNRPRFLHQPPGDKQNWIGDYDPSRYLELKPEVRPVIIKLYGMLERLKTERDNPVVTEDDFLRYMARMDINRLLSKNLLVRLKGDSLLFLGYDMLNWSLRVVVHRLKELRPVNIKLRTSYALEAKKDSLNAKFWKDLNLNIELIEADLEACQTGLKEQLDALPVLKKAGEE
jgi:hypothetical protein